MSIAQTTVLRWPTRLCLALCAALTVSTAAQAQTVRYISSAGNNANNCTRAAPCLTLKRGVSRTPAGSELKILDPGAYGSANIKKSITISSEVAGATVQNIVVDDFQAVVVLRGLLFHGTVLNSGGIAVGLDIAKAAAVHVIRCEIERYAIHGIHFHGEQGANLFISDSVVRTNGGSGIVIVGTPITRLTIDNSRIEDNANNGILASGNIRAAVNRAVISGHGGSAIEQSAGVMTISSSTAANNFHGFKAMDTGVMTVEASVATGNVSVGIWANNGGTVHVSNSASTNNATGFLNNNGTLSSRGNNTVSGNTSNDTSGTITEFDGL